MLTNKCDLAQSFSPKGIVEKSGDEGKRTFGFLGKPGQGFDDLVAALARYSGQFFGSVNRRSLRGAGTANR